MALQSNVQVEDVSSDNVQPFERSNVGQDVVCGVAELVSVLRVRLQEDTRNRKLRKTASAIDVSHPWLAKFRDGHAVCMGIINSLATHYGVKYQISNFDPEELSVVEWEFPEKP
ncbi:MAG: hypothetical protein ACRBHB_19350 [Arenicella sp.]